jgi:tetratricopeptide (TPR) repeat protein
MPTELDQARERAAKEPLRALELENSYIAANPADPRGYFSRHYTHSKLGDYDNALADCDTSIRLDPIPFRYLARADIHRKLGNYQAALQDLNHVHDVEPETWLNAFGPHMRADTLARLGDVDGALADAALLPEDHWMPGHSGLPSGNKRDFTEEIKRRAASAGA